MASHRRSALRVAAVVLGTAQGADDVVQDATERALRAASRFDPGADVRPWFLRIVANTARNRRRARGRRAALVVRAAHRRDLDGASPEDHLVSSDERELVLRALNRLAPDDRLVLALRHFDGLSEREMAISMACPNGTVKSRLARATARLRHELGASDHRGRGGHHA